MVHETEAGGNRSEAVLEALGGVAGAVERAAELEDEAHGRGIGLVAAPLETRIGKVGHGDPG